jgi:hypothetical protein
LCGNRGDFEWDIKQNIESGVYGMGKVAVNLNFLGGFWIQR